MHGSKSIHRFTFGACLDDIWLPLAKEILKLHDFMPNHYHKGFLLVANFLILIVASVKDFLFLKNQSISGCCWIDIFKVQLVQIFTGNVNNPHGRVMKTRERIFFHF